MQTNSLRGASLLTLTLGLAVLTGTAQAQAPTVIFSNLTNYTGSAYKNAGAAVVGGNTITQLVADDINFADGNAGNPITGFTFTVANFNAVAVSARPEVRFYAGDASDGGPGTLLYTGIFDPITFTASQLSGFTATLATPVIVPTDNFIWAGIAFDNNSGTTGATTAQLNNLGQGIFDPPTAGSSDDVFFKTTTQSNYITNNPAGSYHYFGGSPVASFGWEFTSSVAPVPEPGLMLGFSLAFGIGGTRLLARRRKASRAS